MKYFEFYNPTYAYVELPDENGKTISVKPRSRVILSDFFLKYSPSKISVIRESNKSDNLELPKPILTSNKIISRREKITLHRIQPSATKSVAQKKIQKNIKLQLPLKENKKNVFIGRIKKGIDIQNIFNESLQNFDYSISNNIGIGILSYNRLDSLKRLINSIRKFTDLTKVKVFVSDESDDLVVKKWLDAQDDIIFINNKDRLGIAGNTNRLLQALQRFDNIILLNDDVEILKEGWEQFYFNIMKKTKFVHFCYRQIGVYGASEQGESVRIGNVNLFKIKDKPHGAIMALKSNVINKIGFFDESYKEYGMEHVEYSRRVYLNKLQPEGFFDVDGSNKYFRIYHEITVGNKQKYRENLAKYKSNNSSSYVNFSDESRLDGISVVIPIRVIEDRIESLYTIINNIRAQHFPVIEIIISEEDLKPKLSKDKHKPFNYIFTGSNAKFNKCEAFNVGIVNAKFDKIILHDGDIIVPTNYVSQVFNVLNKYDGCHIGSKVLYLDKNSTNKTNQEGAVDISGSVTHMAYTVHGKDAATTRFVGGSIAVNRKTLYNIGGFDTSFVGWGEEDVCFYKALKNNTKFFDERFINFIHLYHSYAPEVRDPKRNNASLYRKLEIQYGDFGEKYIEVLRERFKHRYLK